MGELSAILRCGSASPQQIRCDQQAKQQRGYGYSDDVSRLAPPASEVPRRPVQSLPSSFITAHISGTGRATDGSPSWFNICEYRAGT
jgi:hypothetical protein